MGPGLALLAVNVAIAALFALAYVVIALTIAGQRGALWMALAYAVGLTKPLCDALVPFVAFPRVLEFAGYVGFLSALVLMIPALRKVHGVEPKWGEAALIIGLSTAMRILMLGWPWTSFVHGVAYQTPFVIAALYGCREALRLPGRDRLNGLLAGLFAVLALQFAAKPWIAASVGAGARVTDYVSSKYLLISQAMTGITLVAVGLVLLLLVVLRAVTASQLLAQTDPLSGLFNRRGFEAAAQRLIAGRETTVLLCDLDHFKRINDTLGHDAGDEAIRRFARLMREALPKDAVLGRLGGEEFAAVLPVAFPDGAGHAETLRGLAEASGGTIPAVTASIGVVSLARGHSLTLGLQRADEAAYAAKRGGRNRVEQVPVLARAA